jgi:hypothetical protein
MNIKTKKSNSEFTTTRWSQQAYRKTQHETTHSISRSFFSKSINISNIKYRYAKIMRIIMQVHPLPLNFLVHFSELANHDLCFSIYLIIQKDTRITSLQVSVLLKSAGNAKKKKKSSQNQEEN